MMDGPWQTEAVVSIVAPSRSAKRTAARCPAVLLRERPKIKGAARRENFTRTDDRLRQLDGRTANGREWRARLIQTRKPRLRQRTGVLDIHDPIVVDTHDQIVADTTAHGASHVLVNVRRSFHEPIR